MARRKKVIAKLSRRMRLKLFVLFSGITIGMCGLIGRLMYIEYTSGDKYEKKVLSLQSYDSVTLPFQRGDIVDTNGTVLATSVAVYNVILDCSVMTSDEKYIEPTISALVECFPDLSRGDLEDYAKNKKDSRYIVLEKKLSYDTVQPFVEMQNKTLCTLKLSKILVDTDSHKLADVYKLLTNKEPGVQHRAEPDVIMTCEVLLILKQFAVKNYDELLKYCE